MNWGDGFYERTAATLELAAVRAIDALGIQAGSRVIDLGAGSGNAALEAARRGAVVLAVEPAARLLGVCRQRAMDEGLVVDTVEGDASRIPAGDGAFDALVSVFAVIFAPDADVAAREMLRVVRPGGRIVITSWDTSGPIAEAGMILRGAMAALAPSAQHRAAPAWADRAFVTDLFAKHGAVVSIGEASLPFEAASAEAWFEDQTENHPIWRGVRVAVSAQAGAWESVRERSIAALRAGSLATDRFRTESRYFVITVQRGG